MLMKILRGFKEAQESFCFFIKKTYYKKMLPIIKTDYCDTETFPFSWPSLDGCSEKVIENLSDEFYSG